MAGDYHVKFDMRETVSFLPDYTLLEPKVLGGHESVRVVVDTGDVIYLQHLLVAEADGKTMVIKHWRQDWAYQPRTVLTYASLNTWKTTPVAAGDVAGNELLYAAAPVILAGLLTATLLNTVVLLPGLSASVPVTETRSTSFSSASCTT